MKNLHLYICILMLPLCTCSGLSAQDKNLPIRTGRHCRTANALIEFPSQGGLLIPRMTTQQRRLIPVDSLHRGLVVYQVSDPEGYWLYDGQQWCYLADGDIAGELFGLAPVAYSGSWNDLVDRPEIPQGNLSAVAYSGSWNDLVDRPEIPTGISTLHPVAYSADWNDLTDRPELPTSLSDLEGDAYYQTVTLEESGTWTSASHRPIPRKVSDLKEDEFSQSVTDADIRRWDSAASLNVPTTLRELEQDSLHRLVGDVQMESWNEQATIVYPSSLSEYTSDNYHQAVSREMRETYEQMYLRDIPDRLSDLIQDMDGMLVSAADKQRWNTATSYGAFSGDYNDLRNRPHIPEYLYELKQDSLHMTLPATAISRYEDYSELEIPSRLSDIPADPSGKYYTTVSDEQIEDFTSAYNSVAPSLSSAAQTNRYDSLRNRPTFSAVAYSGQYKDLTGTPDWKMAFVSSGSYKDLTNVPDYDTISPIWVSGDYNDLADRPSFHLLALKQTSRWTQVEGRPMYLDDLEESSNSVHVYQSLSDSLTNLLGIYNDGAPTSSVQGGWKDGSLSLRKDAQFPGHPYFRSNPVTAGNMKERQQYIPTIATAKEADRKVMATSLPSGFPDCTVLPWDRNSAIPSGWSEFTPLRGRFPVGVNVATSGYDEDLTGYVLGQTGGENGHVLTLEEIPRHNHAIRYRTEKVEYRDNLDNERVRRIIYPAEEGEYVWHFDNWIGYAGENVPHENRPPYKSVYFIIKNKNVCHY